MSHSVGSSELARFRNAIAERMGLQFDDSRCGFLAEVLDRRIQATGNGSASYLTSLERNVADEIAALARELTVAETYFFRNMDQFRAYAEVSLPERVAAERGELPIRILSLGCASGEEPYSLAILVRENVEASIKVSIQAIDVNPAVLAKAARGRYSSWALRETAPAFVRRWFHMDGKDAILDETIRASVKFEARNLVDDDPAFWVPSAFDVVFCRNVLMYFAPESAKAVLRRIAQSMMPGGFLFLGHAETLRGLSSDFHLRHTHGTFYYQRRSGASEPEIDPISGSSSPQRTALTIEDGESWIDVIRNASERVRTLTLPRAPATHRAPVTEPRNDLGGVLALMHEERFGVALDLVESLGAESTRDPDLLLLHAVLLIHGGRLPEAESVARKLLQVEELNAGAHYVVALCREGAGDQKGALDHDQVAIYLDPTFAMPRLHIGLYARRTGDHATARQELSQALALLQREDSSRLLFFGGGFRREALIALCDAELQASRSQS